MRQIWGMLDWETCRVCDWPCGAVRTKELIRAGRLAATEQELMCRKGAEIRCVDAWSLRALNPSEIWWEPLYKCQSPTSHGFCTFDMRDKHHFAGIRRFTAFVELLLFKMTKILADTSYTLTERETQPLEALIESSWPPAISMVASPVSRYASTLVGRVDTYLEQSAKGLEEAGSPIF